MRKTLPLLLVLLVLGLAWTTWRVVSLSREVDRLSALDAPGAEAPPDLGRAAPPPSGPPTRLAPAPAPDEGVARRLAALERRLEALQTQWDASEGVRRELALLVAEMTDVRVKANETAAVARTRQSVASQAQFQASARCDVDRNGTGEFGGFQELSGRLAGRLSARLNPNVLSPRGTVTPGGEVVLNGYVFRFFLPDAHGEGVGEPATGFTPTIVDARLAETTWCCYAWPETYGRTGKRTFFVYQGGDTLATDCPTYDGPGSGPRPDAAFPQAGRITGPAAEGTKGSDGNVWTQVD